MTQLLEPAIARGKSSQTVPLYIKAGQSERLRATGSTFYVVESPARIEIRADNLAASEYAAGTGMDCEGAAFFEVLDVRNPHAFDIEVKIYVGFAKYRDQRAAVIEPPTRVKGHGKIDLAANTAYPIPDTLATGDIRRKGVVVSNGDGTNLRIQLRDAAGNPFAIILPGETAAVPVSGPMQVFNPNPGGAISIYVGEIFWTL